MKYFVLIFVGSILFCTMNLAFGQPMIEIGRNVSTYLFDYEKPTVLHCFERPYYAQGQLIPDIGYPPENFDEKMGKFLLEHTVTSNSNEIHLKIALLDKQNKTIPHVGFFLNVTKHSEASFTKLFHTHSGTLDIILNQNYSASEWSSEGKLEPHQGGLESDNDHFIVNTPMLSQGTYHFDVIGFSAYNDTELFTLTCAPKFDWSLLINEYDSVEILTDSKVDHDSHVLYYPPSKQIRNGISITDIKCNEGLEFVIKSSDNSPACVKLDTKEKLIERGWAIVDQLEDKIITSEDNDKIINIKKGESFVVKLDSGYDWRIDINNKTVVDSDYSDIRYSGSQGVYRALNSGQAILTGIGDPSCLSLDPPCMSPSILFQLNINVK